MKPTIKPLTALVALAVCSALQGCASVSSATDSPVNYAVVQQAPSAYTVPAATDVVLYQVNIRAFSESGDFKGVEQRLDHIKALGVNMIYLMPIYPIGKEKGINSPYSITSHRRVNPEFGTLADLQSLVKSAHQRGLGVMLDFIPNHTAWDHPWLAAHPDWYVRHDDGTPVNPHGWGDVIQLNFNNPDLRKALIDDMTFWVREAGIDGFRFDYSDGPSVDFWHQAVSAVRNSSHRQLLLLAEGSRNENFETGVDFNFGFGFFDRLKDVFGGESAKHIDDWQQTENKLSNDHQRVVRYTTNHDVNGSDGTPEQLFGGTHGALAAFVTAAFMRSTPMIYNGQEIGLPYRLTFPFTEQNINWQPNPEVTEKYRALIALFNQHQALRTGSLTTHSSKDVVAYTRTSDEETILVLVNTRDSASTYALPDTISHSRWLDLLSEQRVGKQDSVVLAPYEYRILKQQR